MIGTTIRFSAEFGLMSRDGILYSSEDSMIAAARTQMIDSGKVFTTQARSNFSGLAVEGGRFARKQARKNARREQRELQTISSELGLS